MGASQFNRHIHAFGKWMVKAFCIRQRRYLTQFYKDPLWDKILLMRYEKFRHRYSSQ